VTAQGRRADAAEVAPRTVSAYFPSKEELVFPDHDEIFSSLEARLTDREPGETVADALRAWIGTVLDLRDHADPQELRRRRELIESDPSLRTFERGLMERAELPIAVAAAVDLGLGPDDLLPHMVGAATMAALDALGREAKRTGFDPAGSRERGLELLDQTLTFIGAGVEALVARARES